MTVRIVLDGPHRSVGLRLVRALAVLVGLPLIAAGVLGWAGVAVMTYFLAISSAPASDLRQSVPAAIAFPAAAFIGLPLGIRLLRGKRRAVLFLRRFGFADATRSLSFAANAVIGRSWRLVTLDDAKVKPVGGPAAPRRLASLTIVVAIAAGAGFTWWLKSKGIDYFIRHTRLTSSTCTTDICNEAGPILATIGAVMVAAVIFVLVVSFVISSALFSGLTYRFARRAERARRVEIKTPQDVNQRSRAITRRGSRIFAPRLLVVTVANEVWRQAVSSFARDSAAVIIDVSIPSDSLRWEINTLLPTLGRRCILVGRLDLLTRPGPDGRTVFASGLGRDIDGHDVLAYRPDGSGVRRFSRALRATIESRASR